ncbi:SOS response-associated peptidase [Vibrio parahaemolyticus]|uniref:SOS response-associated peptidase n=1 Tax=Vibrio parahaemolyticus TaxID=670 RepID=UPI0006A29DE4|nr:SOS response-associated peptidase family protein [Vibrio parahaemolyticus]AKU57551.1 hypothetical protein FORC8_3991 [Vibrio parahaemolyticus]APE86611.1 protein of unknown function DUF159 [Vibrio parahaemolyticus]MCZ6294702.1 SOS response-associated peptidase family protein [Vibrio parahaemolyticus]MDF5238734.1 SOS response-associated peptidase family protein [Vibrio parahaemolyticus]MDG2720239.1 SOS response-associated peptidase family protein [Vibrio parahaemolyticus]
MDLSWGIKPSWAKRIIINAQAETVSIKPTFTHSFEKHRVIVPCSGWYEWREEQGKKVKYLFRQQDGSALYMAGIALEDGSKVVTLTTKPNRQCADFHHRMPLLIPEDAVLGWISGNRDAAYQLIGHQWDGSLEISAC